MATLSVSSRFNGPPASGQGGLLLRGARGAPRGPRGSVVAATDSARRALEVRVENDDAVRVEDGAEGVAAGTVTRASDAAGELIPEGVPTSSLAPWDVPQ